MIWLLLILLAISAAVPFVVERRKPDMSDALRATAPGQFARLSDGKTHYQWHGPKTGRVLVCIHGLTTPSFVYNALLPGLTDLGYRVLTYDLYGRGFSDRPRGVQTRSFFIRQLRDLLQDQGVVTPVTLIGYSMGGGIATVLAAEEPHRINRLILLAPVGMEYRITALNDVIRRSGSFGLWLMLAFGGAMLRRGTRDPSIPKDLARRMADETRLRGYLPAVLSSQRNFLAAPLEEEHRIIAADGVPILAIWGETDTIIPLSALGQLVQWNRDARNVTVPGAGHGLAFTHPDAVLDPIRDVDD